MMALACSSDPSVAPVMAEPSAPQPVASLTVAPAAKTDDPPSKVPAPPLDDPSRCARVRELVEASSDLGALQRALNQEEKLGLVAGETATAGGALVSFCVTAERALSPAACLSPLGFDKPLAIRMPSVKGPQWQVHQSRPRPGKPLATVAPRFGPAAMVPQIAAPPSGELLPDAPKELPIFSVDRDRDRIVALCFVQRAIGEP